MKNKKLNFQEKVFEVVKRIPKGSVMTYKDVAIAIGNPSAARAVGNALNKNKELIKIPCHRVVKSDHGVGGYTGGTKKKIELLKKEGVKIEKGKLRKIKSFF